MVFDHDLFTCQELINSGMIVINLAIKKSFVDDRNSFIIEERRNLDINLNTSLDLVIQQEKIHSQAPAQEDEQKEKNEHENY